MSGVAAKKSEGNGRFRHYLDKTVVWPKARWVSAATSLLVFGIRVKVREGFYLVAYAAGCWPRFPSRFPSSASGSSSCLPLKFLRCFSEYILFLSYSEEREREGERNEIYCVRHIGIEKATNRKFTLKMTSSIEKSAT